MKTITIHYLKAHWAKIEAEVEAGEAFEVLNRGKVTAHIVPATPRQVLQWPDHLATAYESASRKGSDIVRKHRRRSE